MHKFKLVLFGATAAITFSSAGMAQHASHGQMTAEQHKQMMANRGPEAQKVTHATGVVKAINAGKDAVTIAHDPIAARKWPATTMTFKLNKKVLGKVKAGQRVKFTFEGDSSYAVTKLARI